jgi:hypothetical protein
MENFKEKPVFKLGLTLAGAASSAAYTAGVLDMLFSALESWEEYGKNNYGPSGPPHRVELAAISGASSGGMGAALIAAVLSSIPRNGGITGNPFFNAIVEGADCVEVEDLLDVKDIVKERGRLYSLCDTSRIESVAEEKLTRFNATGYRPPYVADPLRIFIPVTNLQGVPYGIPARGTGGAGYEMSLRADHVQFLLTWSNDVQAPEGIILDANDPESPGWKQLYEVALATGAFPLILKPRRLKIKAETYKYRKWTIARDKPSAGICREVNTIPPTWNKSPDDPVEFWALDGGTMNNEPFELVRCALARLPKDEDGEREKSSPVEGRKAEKGDIEAEKRNPRQGNEADRAVVMIDPIQESLSSEPPDHVSILGTAVDIVLSLHAQAQFKMEDLELARKPDCYSRFIIAPVRRPDGQDSPPVPHPLATAGLGGFAGFLDSRFRKHDFELGRYNCVRFLRKHFILPDDSSEKNKLFEQWKTTEKNDFKVDRDGKNHLPIIPLVGKAATDAKHPCDWPKVGESRLEYIRRLLLKRLNAVVPRLIRQLGLGRCGLLNIGIKLGWYMLEDVVVDTLIDRVSEGLKERSQYEER